MQAIGVLGGGIAHDFNNVPADSLSNVGLARAVRDKLPRSQVLDDRLAVDEVSLPLPIGLESGMGCVRKFIEDSKSEGLIKAAVQGARLRGTVEK
jgi:hypothetical protein